MNKTNSDPKRMSFAARVYITWKEHNQLPRPLYDMDADLVLYLYALDNSIDLPEEEEK